MKIKFIILFFLIFLDLLSAQGNRSGDNPVLATMIKTEILPEGKVKYTLNGLYKSDVDLEQLEKYRSKKQLLTSDSNDEFLKRLPIPDALIFILPKSHKYEYNFDNDSTFSIVSDTSFSIKELEYSLERDHNLFLIDKIISKRKSKEYDSTLYKKVFEKNVTFPLPGGFRVLKYEKIRNNQIRVIVSSNLIETKKMEEKYLFNFYLSDFIITKKNGEYSVEFEDKTKKKNLRISTDDPAAKGKFNSVCPVEYSSNKKGFLFFNKYADACIDYSKFAMRVLDSNYNYIWENKDDIIGYCDKLMYNFDDDGICDIILFSHSHKDSIIIFERNGL
ncbi:MAG: hypothetical protein WCZ90_19775 [Melioribacteraceae bacterium]